VEKRRQLATAHSAFGTRVSSLKNQYIFSLNTSTNIYLKDQYQQWSKNVIRSQRNTERLFASNIHTVSKLALFIAQRACQRCG
jgi:hypothetical protein